jgi:gliding motility-associated-like protein
MLSGAQHMFQARYKPDTSCVVEGIYDVPRKKCNSDQYLIYAPNIFAPDVHFFQVFPTAIAQIRSIQIFNRWGSLVYQHTGETPEWDGTINGRPAAPGVYAFWIEYLDKRDESIQVQTGDVLLLR